MRAALGRGRQLQVEAIDEFIELLVGELVDALLLSASAGPSLADLRRTTRPCRCWARLGLQSEHWDVSPRVCACSTARLRFRAGAALESARDDAQGVGLVAAARLGRDTLALMRSPEMSEDISMTKNLNVWRLPVSLTVSGICRRTFLPFFVSASSPS